MYSSQNIIDFFEDYYQKIPKNRLKTLNFHGKIMFYWLLSLKKKVIRSKMAILTYTKEKSDYSIESLFSLLCIVFSIIKNNKHLTPRVHVLHDTSSIYC